MEVLNYDGLIKDQAVKLFSKIKKNGFIVLLLFYFQ